MDSRRSAVLAALVSATVASAQPALELEMPSCVAGSPSMRVPVTAERAALDAADRKRFHDAAKARYALYQRGSGLVPTQVLMLRRGRHWQYVTLWNRGAAGLCFSAVFAAERFDFTPEWIAKYRPQAADVAD